LDFKNHESNLKQQGATARVQTPSSQLKFANSDTTGPTKTRKYHNPTFQ